MLGFKYRPFPLPADIPLSKNKDLMKEVKNLLMRYAGFTLGDKGVLDTLKD